MRAAVHDRYGGPDVVEVREVDRPEASRGQVRVRVVASAVNSGDVRMRAADFGSVLYWIPARLFIGVLRPRRKILGTGFSGVVDAVGEGVEGFGVGDRVFGSVGMRMGAHAEWLVVDADGAVVHTPDALADDDAASLIFGGFAANCFLREKGKIRAGHRVLIYGASGALGSMAVQIAKHDGARVTAVCSGKNAELVRGLGADDVIDYTKESVDARGGEYDIVFDTVGKTSYRACRGVMKKGGVYLTAVSNAREIFQSLWTPLFGHGRVVGGVAMDKRAYLEELVEMYASGAVRGVIDRRYPLDEISAAHAYVDAGHKVGSVIVRMHEDQL